MAPKILVVLTSVDKMVGSGLPTGWYLPELAHPYEVLEPKAELVFASPKGGVAPIDQGSVEMFKADPVSTEFYANKKSVWENTKPLKDFADRVSEFDAVFYPGGHGPMFDLATDAVSIKLIEDFVKAGKPVAAVCHGPAVFVNVPGLLQGKDVTGFSNAEEEAVQLTSSMPFLLEDAIKKAGATYVKAAEPWAEKVVTSGLVITGQNPASAKATGEALAKALGL
ncbi:DJ-1/PfpI family [Geosmithia morbida]|uniref:D-lactate dehydratase n=1 Tax=Geosmithia morbida TaxID=1094350 RepID=A0A9P5D1N3_9HYPO|nr:DJ-1/PfpI family [Geosmithia morbida]KAF4120646.1 DJ-1/PfpI family [Geosmithia morbida]